MTNTHSINSEREVGWGRQETTEGEAATENQSFYLLASSGSSLFLALLWVPLEPQTVCVLFGAP